MYQEEHNSFQGLKLMLRVFIVLLVVLLSIRFIFIISNRSLGKKDTTFEENLKYINDCSKDYFNETNIPKNIGESKEYKISDILTEDQITYMDEHIKKIDYSNSLIKVTRLENEYQIKILINYEGETNYINTFVDIEKHDIIVIPTTTKKITSTTKKAKTTKSQKYKVSFNTNGGLVIEDIYVTKNTKINVTPTREGYTFIGWYYNGVPFNNIIDKDYVLVAKWAKNQ